MSEPNQNDTQPETPLPPTIPPSLPAPPPPPPAPPQAAQPTRSTRSARNPIVAIVLSLFPGLGQIYNGQLVKALVFFFAWAGSIWLTADGVWQFGLVVPFVYLINLVDAYRSALYLGDRPAKGLEFDEQPESPAWGVGLVILGGVLLLNNLGWLPRYFFARYWPVFIIAAGAAFVWNAVRRRGDV